MTDLISVAEVAEDLGCNPQSIRSQAHADPAMLGFPVSVVGSRILIPRKGYEQWKEGNQSMIKLYKQMLNELRLFAATDPEATLLEKLGLVERVIDE